MPSICDIIALSDQAVAGAFCFCLSTSLQPKVVGKMPLLCGAFSAPLFDLTLGSVAQKGHFVMETKRCSKCGLLKPLKEFYKDNQRKGGYGRYCRNCMRLYNNERRANYLEARERHRFASSRWSKQHKEKVAVYMKRYGPEYYQANREKILARTKKYKHEHPEKRRSWDEGRRARENGAEGSFTDKEFIALCEQYNNKCLACNSDGPLTVDHVIPLSKEGTNGIDNIQPLCGICNSKKGTKIIDYRKKERTNEHQGFN